MFDPVELNPAYFDRLRKCVTAARDRGIYVGVMLLGGHYQCFGGWRGNPFTRPITRALWTPTLVRWPSATSMRPCAGSLDHRLKRVAVDIPLAGQDHRVGFAVAVALDQPDAVGVVGILRDDQGPRASPPSVDPALEADLVVHEPQAAVGHQPGGSTGAVLAKGFDALEADVARADAGEGAAQSQAARLRDDRLVNRSQTPFYRLDGTSPLITGT